MQAKLGLAAFAASILALTAPADAKHRDRDRDRDAEIYVSVGDPYTYDGYRSERWYRYNGRYDDDYYDDRRRSGRRDYSRRYGGYDCYKAFYYTWQRGHRVKYKSTWCHNDRGRPYEVRGTRVIVRVG